MSKFVKIDRNIPIDKNSLQYQAYLATISDSDDIPSAKSLIKILLEYYNQGNDYFRCLKYIRKYDYILSQLKLLSDKKLTATIGTDYLHRTLELIKKNTNYPDNIYSHLCNVLITKCRKFKENL